MQALFMALFAVVIAVADQLVKYFVVANIPLHSVTEFLPGFLSLTYVRNYGAAWSSMQGMRWLFVFVLLVFLVGVIWEYKTNYMSLTTFERWCVAAICGGGIGNAIDRIRMGYVVDMLKTEFIDFPIFNVADCFIVCGAILLVGHLVLFNRSVWKEEKKK